MMVPHNCNYIGIGNQNPQHIKIILYVFIFFISDQQHTKQDSSNIGGRNISYWDILTCYAITVKTSNCYTLK